MRPHILGIQHELEYEVAERVQAMVPCAERVAFTSSGSEAVQIALRLARGFTGRNLVVKFEGHYHGWLDSVLIGYRPKPEDVAGAPVARVASRGQVPNAVDNVLVARWNDAAALESLFRDQGDKIAAVIMEPVLCNSGGLMPKPGYLQAARDLCRRYGALLIFDEVITGFRIGPGGAQAHFGVTPDLATFGKALAGGLPLSAVAGRADVMDQIADGGVAFGGTFNGNPMSLAAARATLDELAGGELLRTANQTGELLMGEIRRLAEKHSVPLVVCGFGSAFALHFTSGPEPFEYRDTLRDSQESLRAYLMAALTGGLHLLPDGRIYVSAVHSREDVDKTAGIIDRVLADMRSPVAVS
jgi:glutamate-1-semialdehyde 2,1-aminomutase